MIQAKKSPFEQAASYLGKLQPVLTALPRRVTDGAREIRLRAGQPVTLELAEERLRLETEITTAAEIGDYIKVFCDYSVHSFEKQLREGWLTLRGGHRAGFCGTAVTRGGKVETIRDISSVNLRIAREYKGCADELCRGVISADLRGLLITGRPMSAKTTVLRDLCRSLSKKYKIALIDERGELAAMRSGERFLDVGNNTDVLDGFPKAEGILTALRCLSPEYIACDEIGGETDELRACLNNGVKIIITAHASGIEEALASPRINALISAGGISHIALLGTGKQIGKLMRFEELKNERYSYHGGACDADLRNGFGSVLFVPPESAGGKIKGTAELYGGNGGFNSL